MVVIFLQTELHSTLHLTKHIGHTLIVHLEKIFADSLSFDAIKELKGLRLHTFVSKRLNYKLSKFCNKMSAAHQMFVRYSNDTLETDR